MLKKFISKLKNRKKLINKNTTIYTKNIPDVLFETIGRNCVLNKEVEIFKEDTKIGDYTYINGGKLFYCEIGKFCSIGYGVCIGSGEHYIDKVTTYPLKYKVMKKDGLIDFPIQKKVIIGNDVWIGNNVVIKQGVNIGDGSIIGTGAVVTRDVEPYSIVVGIPAKKIRDRLDNKDKEKLLKIKWWNWTDEQIIKALENEEFENIEIFIRKYYTEGDKSEA